MHIVIPFSEHIQLHWPYTGGSHSPVKKEILLLSFETNIHSLLNKQSNCIYRSQVKTQ